MDPEGLSDWYANLFRLDRRKCLLFTNERTLYTFLVPGVLKRDFSRLDNLFTSLLGYNLQYEGFDIETVERILGEYVELGIAKTMNRSVLGSMNDLR